MWDWGMNFCGISSVARCWWWSSTWPGADGRNAWDDYKQLLAELELYDPALLKKPRLIAANKMDEPVAEPNLKKFKRKAGKIRIVPMAAGFDEGIDQFKKAIRQAVDHAGES